MQYIEITLKTRIYIAKEGFWHAEASAGSCVLVSCGIIWKLIDISCYQEEYLSEEPCGSKFESCKVKHSHGSCSAQLISLRKPSFCIVKRGLVVLSNDKKPLWKEGVLWTSASHLESIGVASVNYPLGSGSMGTCLCCGLEVNIRKRAPALLSDKMEIFLLDRY